MQGWACGHCKHCATLFYHLHEYIQLELKSVSDDKTCTDILQTWMYLVNQEILGQLYFLN